MTIVFVGDTVIFTCTISGGLCTNNSIEYTLFTICESITNCSTTSLNNTQYINYTTTLSSTVIMTAKLSLPENRFLTLSFVIQYSNGQEMESSLFTISKSILDLSLHNVIIISSLINQIHIQKVLDKKSDEGDVINLLAKNACWHIMLLPLKLTEFVEVLRCNWHC